MQDRREMVVGLFRDAAQARGAIEALKDAGCPARDISLLMPARAESGAEAGAGTATGALAGGVLGGVAGWLVGLGALAIPGLGPFIGAGVLASTLAGAAIGAGVGGIAGALTDLGLPESEAGFSEQEVRDGATLVGVRAPGRVEEVRELLRRFGAYDVERRATPAGAPPTSEPAAAPDSADFGPMEPRGPIDSGVAVAGTGSSTAFGASGDLGPAASGLGTASGAAMGTTGRAGVSGTPSMGGTTGGSAPPTATASTWTDAPPRLRAAWNQRYAGRGEDWRDHEARYRYGWEAAHSPAYRGRSWQEVEPELRCGWESQNTRSTWDEVQNQVRDAWDVALEARPAERSSEPA